MSQLSDDIEAIDRKIAGEPAWRRIRRLLLSGHLGHAISEEMESRRLSPDPRMEVTDLEEEPTRREKRPSGVIEIPQQEPEK